jgi:hypothetical protein
MQGVRTLLLLTLAFSARSTNHRFQPIITSKAVEANKVQCSTVLYCTVPFVLVQYCTSYCSLLLVSNVEPTLRAIDCCPKKKIDDEEMMVQYTVLYSTVLYCTVLYTVKITVNETRNNNSHVLSTTRSSRRKQCKSSSSYFSFYRHLFLYAKRKITTGELM